MRLANISKCFPSNRVWPQKCDRCIAHRPDALECSEPELNTRKRGPNRELKDKTRDKEKDKTKDKSPQPPNRTQTTASTSETLEPDTRESTIDDDDDGGSTYSTEIDERPKRTEPVVPRLKEPIKPVIRKEDVRPASCYQTLAEGEFRILKLAPGKKDDRNISCSFVTASVKNKIERYEAISYLWGASKPTSTTIDLIDPDGRSNPIFIRTHIYDALRALRSTTKVRSFWVDALCINYGNPDHEERNTQTAMKRYVFRNADNLCFWLGEDEDLKTALRFIPQTLDLTAIDDLVGDDTKSNVDNWAAFVTLLKNPAFSRLWLVQEVAVAHNVTLHSGSVSIHYQDLVDAVAIFKAFRDKLCVMFHQAGRNCKELFDRKITITERFIEVSVNSLRVSATQDELPKTQRLLSLEELVSYLSRLKASEVLDRIYSVLAIAKDGPKLDEKTLVLDKGGDLKIDYKAKVVDVFQLFVLRAIERSKSLDIMCRCWADKDKSLPTWVLPLQSLQPQFDSDISEPTEAESLVGLPDHNHYHASRGTSAIAVVSETPATGKRSLTVSGFRLDTIAKLAPRASEGIILWEWLKLGGCDKKKTKQGIIHTVPESFWRTLVADRGPKGTMPPSWYSIAFKYCLLHLTSTGDINTNRMIHECEEGKFSLVVSFLQRVQSVIWNRKFLVSKTNEWIGLAPTAAEPGDELVILAGCSVPVVLRPVEESGKIVGWYLVGECYVHGMMDGEATDPLRENQDGPPGPPNVEEFIIL